MQVGGGAESQKLQTAFPVLHVEGATEKPRKVGHPTIQVLHMAGGTRKVKNFETQKLQPAFQI